MRHLMFLAAAAVSLAGCNVQTSANGDASSDASSVAGAPSQSEAEAEVAAVTRDFLSGDAMKIMAHYAPGAVMLDAANPTPTADRNDQTRFATEFVSMKPSDLVADLKTIQILGKDIFVASGIASFLADVGPGRDRLSVRYTQVFQRQPDGRWLIVNEHMSMPPAAPGSPAA